MPSPITASKQASDFGQNIVVELIAESADQPSKMPPGVIGIVRGPMGIIEGKSLNDRWYSRSLWEKCLQRENDRIAGGQMFGTLSHDVPLNEDTIAKGLITHRVSQLWINESNQSLDGELHIIDTPAGRNLFEVMRQGWKVAVSTRGYGPIYRGRGPNGTDAIDEDLFHLAGIDFVVNPGASIAKPDLVAESLKEKTAMEDNKLFESLQKNNVDLHVQLNESVKENAKLSNQINESVRVTESLKRKLGPDPIATLERIEEGLRKYQELEPFKQLAKDTDLFSSQQGPGFAEMVASVVNENLAYRKLGKQSEINEDKALLESYKKIGTVKEVSAAADMAIGFAQFKKKPAELKALFESANKVIKTYNEVRIKAASAKIAKQFKLAEPIVESLLKTNGNSAKKTIEFLKEQNKINEAKQTFGTPATQGQPAVRPIVPTTAKTETGSIDSIFESHTSSLSPNWKAAEYKTR